LCCDRAGRSTFMVSKGGRCMPSCAALLHYAPLSLFRSGHHLAKTAPHQPHALSFVAGCGDVFQNNLINTRRGTIHLLITAHQALFLLTAVRANSCVFEYRIEAHDMCSGDFQFIQTTANSWLNSRWQIRASFSSWPALIWLVYLYSSPGARFANKLSYLPCDNTCPHMLFPELANFVSQTFEEHNQQKAIW